MKTVTVTVLETIEEVLTVAKQEGENLVLVIDDGMAHFNGPKADNYTIDLDESESYDKWFYAIAELSGINLHLT